MDEGGPKRSHPNHPKRRRISETSRWLEEYSTPREFAAALADSGTLGEHAKAALAAPAMQDVLRGTAPEPYQRFEQAIGVSCYTDAAVAAVRKTLVICFAGAVNRPMLPVALLLQAIPAARYDVVMLRDRAGNHFAHGVDGYAASLRALATRVAAEFRAESYARVVSIGMSMGGLPALRAGAILRSDRAVSIGGRQIWYVNRVLDPGRRQIVPLDVLCSCNSLPTELVCVHSRENEEDRAAVDQLAFLPIRRIEVASSASHNVLIRLHKRGLLPTFLEAMLGSRPIDTNYDWGADEFKRSPVSALA